MPTEQNVMEMQCNVNICIARKIEYDIESEAQNYFTTFFLLAMTKANP